MVELKINRRYTNNRGIIVGRLVLINEWSVFFEGEGGNTNGYATMKIKDKNLIPFEKSHVEDTFKLIEN